MQITERFNYLFAKYLEDTISIQEKAEFLELVATGDFDTVMDAHLEKTIQEPGDDVIQQLPDEAGQQIFNNIITSDATVPMNVKAGKNWVMSWRLVAAAVVIFIATLSIYIYAKTDNSNQFASHFIRDNSEHVTNNTTAPLPVALADGSLITLQPKSSLYYSSRFFNNKREVYMEGEALFNIAKDSTHPFYVYYGSVVTKVLGTSFTVRTNTVSGTIEVAVLAGKVQVFENDKIRKDAADNKGVIVTPNQKAVYQTVKRVFAATLVDKPILINAGKATNSQESNESLLFNFNDAKLSTVIKTIEANYGISIKVNNEAIYHCAFSGDVSKEDLYDKLKIICLAIGAEYKISGTQILIKGKGCE